MSGVFPVIMLVFWLFRALSSSNSSRSGFGTTTDTGAARNNATQIPSWVGWFAVKLILYFFIGAVVMADSGAFARIVLHTVAAFLILPGLFIRFVFIPLGMVRTAYWTFRCLRGSGFGKEYRLGACVMAALALARRRDREPGSAWLAGQLPHIAAIHLGYDMLVGLIAALNGKHDTARTVFHLIDTTKGPDALRRIARDWLVADAAAKGDWQDVIWRGRRGRDSFRWSYAVARMAERIDHRREAPADWLLILLFLRAPRRLRLWPLLDKARSVPRRPKKAEIKAIRPQNWQQAVAELAAMLRKMEQTGKPPTRTRFAAGIQGAAAALVAPALRERLEERLRTLNPNLSDPRAGADAAIAATQGQLVRLARTLIERAPELAEDGAERPLISDAIDDIRRLAFQEIETLSQDFARRTAEDAALPGAEEWAAWAALRARAERLLKLAPQSEDALFAAMYTPMCNFAVHQHNTLQRHRLAHDIFCWLKRHSASNPVAAELLRKNAMAYSGMRKNSA